MESVNMSKKQPYSDEELQIYFSWVAKGYCWKQSAEKAGMDPERIERNFDDIEVRQHLIDVACDAGGRIRAGVLPAPTDRWDGLWDDYIK